MSLNKNLKILLLASSAIWLISSYTFDTFVEPYNPYNIENDTHDVSNDNDNYLDEYIDEDIDDSDESNDLDDRLHNLNIDICNATVDSEESLRDAITGASNNIPTTICILDDISLDSVIVTGFNRNITIRSSSETNFRIYAPSGARHFQISTGSTLILENITLSGNSGVGGGVEVNGFLIMNERSIITGNTATGNGGGVLVNNGILTMNAGSNITRNTAAFGGGVSVTRPAPPLNPTDDFNHNLGQLIMNDGSSITGNTANSNGGGVQINNAGQFTMNNGLISENSATNGGGVFASHTLAPSFTMLGGNITNNIVIQNGGGVFLNANASFEMNGGTISGHITATHGGGVFVTDNGNFTMGGEARIVDNTVTSQGGGIHIAGTAELVIHDGMVRSNNATSGGGIFATGAATFMMNNGEIASNDASQNGGGVELIQNSAFLMNAGEINENTATHGAGVSVIGSAVFSMTTDNAILSRNIATGNGGGVRIQADALFYLAHGTISENIAGSHGGGVHIFRSPNQDEDRPIVFGEGKINGNQAQNGAGVSVLGDTTLQIILNPSIIIQPPPIIIELMNNTETNTETSTEISGNIASGDGGGIFLSNESKLIMEYGMIYNNQAGRGGGVFTTHTAQFNMTNGEIRHNQAGFGGGVAIISSSEFINNAGVIHYNQSTSSGGGVYIANNGIFTMNNGTIRNNTAQANGGGIVMINANTKFIMNDGIISDNKADFGGGIAVLQGRFHAEAGAIIENEANINSGGIFWITETILHNIRINRPVTVVDNNTNDFTVYINDTFNTIHNLEANGRIDPRPWTGLAGNHAFNGNDIRSSSIELFVINFFWNDGTSPEDEQSEQIIVSSGNVIDVNAINKPYDPEGKKFFLEWTTDREGHDPFDFTTEITSDMNLYAQWGLRGLSFEFVPPSLSFETQNISNGWVEANRADPNWQIRIQDTRINVGAGIGVGAGINWRLYATVTNPFETINGHALQEAHIIFRLDGQPDRYLSDQAQIIHVSNPLTVAQPITTIMWERNEGLLLRVNPIMARANEIYSTTITWELRDAP